MALEKTGVSLEAENYKAYISHLREAQQALVDFNRASDQAAGEASGKLGMGEAAVIGLASALGTVLVNAAISAGQALIGIGADAVRMAGDLEAQMSTIAALLGSTDEEAAQLKDTILDLAVSPTLKVSAQEAADAVEALVRSGVKADEIMAGAAESTVLLANATGADFASAASIAADTMKVFNIAAEDMNAAVSGITSVTTNSKFKIDDYRLALAQGGGAAAALGVSFEDFNTVLAGTSKLFGSGSDAGTAFKTFLLRLTPSSDKAADAMDELGLEFFDSNGQMKDMDEIAGELQRALGGLSEAERSAALNTIFGTDALRTAVGLAEIGADGFAALQAQMGDTDAVSMAAQRMDNFNGSLEIFKGVVEALQIRAGEFFLGTMKGGLDRASQALESAEPLIMSFAQGAGQAFSGLMTTLGALAQYFGAVVTDGDTLNDFLGQLPEPIQPIVQAVGKLLAAFIDTMPMIQTYVGDMARFVQDQFALLGPQLSKNISSTLTTIAEFWRTHGDEVMAIVNFVFRTVVVVAGTFLSALSTAVAYATNVITGIWSAFSALLRGDWAGAWRIMSETTQRNIQLVKDFVSNFMERVLAIVGTNLETFTADWRRNWELAKTLVTTIGGKIVEAVEKAVQDAIDGALKLARQASDIGKAFVDGIVQGVTKAAQAVADAAASLVRGAIAAAQGEAGAHSPSRVAAKKIGRPISQGAALGMWQGLEQVRRAGVALAENAIAIPATSASMYAGATFNNQRSATVNMGPTSVHNGMDLGLLRAVIQQTVAEMI